MDSGMPQQPATSRATSRAAPSRTRQAGAIVVGILVLALASRISIPMLPVPITAQTLVIMLVGALCGWRLGAVTVVAWLLLAALGLPLLSDGGAGLAAFTGPTAGYLISFPLVAALVGWLAERGWDGSRPAHAFAAMALAQALCLAMGATWLATLIGPAEAITAGVLPFIPGAVIKAAIGASILLLASKRVRSRSQTGPE